MSRAHLIAVYPLTFLSYGWLGIIEAILKYPCPAHIIKERDEDGGGSVSSMTGGLFVHTPLDFHARCRTGACRLASPPRHATTPPHPMACRHDCSVLPARMKACPRPRLDRWTTGCRPGNTQAKRNRHHPATVPYMVRPCDCNAPHMSKTCHHPRT